MPERKRRFGATVRSDYPGRLADAVARALQADNLNNEDVTVVTESDGGSVVSRLEAVNLEKLLPVLDDLLFCQSVCERTLDVTRGQAGERKRRPRTASECRT